MNTLKVDLALSIEKLLPMFLRKKWTIISETLEPNKQSNFLSALINNESTLKIIAERVVSHVSGEDQRGANSKEVC